MCVQSEIDMPELKFSFYKTNISVQSRITLENCYTFSKRANCIRTSEKIVSVLLDKHRTEVGN